MTLRTFKTPAVLNMAMFRKHNVVIQSLPCFRYVLLSIGAVHAVALLVVTLMLSECSIEKALLVLKIEQWCCSSRNSQGIMFSPLLSALATLFISERHSNPLERLTV